MKLIRWILAVFLPPVSVFMTSGFGVTLFINIALTLLGWVPGMIHAVWVLAKHEEKLNNSEGTV
jgi:uncharacterized membrane protein YqaE (UPF0057 family)